MYAYVLARALVRSRRLHASLRHMNSVESAGRGRCTNMASHSLEKRSQTHRRRLLYRYRVRDSEKKMGVRKIKKTKYERGRWTRRRVVFRPWSSLIRCPWTATHISSEKRARTTQEKTRSLLLYRRGIYL